MYRPTAEQYTETSITFEDKSPEQIKELLFEFVNQIDLEKDQEALFHYFNFNPETHRDILRSFLTTLDQIELLGGKCFTVEYQGRVLGISYFDHKARSSSASIFLLPEIRGLGIGHILFDTVTKIALVTLDKKIDSLLLSVHNSNTASFKTISKITQTLEEEGHFIEVLKMINTDIVTFKIQSKSRIT
ncbi:MAG: hypothetical protein Q9M91_01500 [Candidatus Dojkabacteria bacterium]|nr:hypothetical protein [Candidatus Dojkabacteria bacterium]